MDVPAVRAACKAYKTAPADAALEAVVAALGLAAPDADGDDVAPELPPERVGYARLGAMEAFLKDRT